MSLMVIALLFIVSMLAMLSRRCVSLSDFACDCGAWDQPDSGIPLISLIRYRIHHFSAAAFVFGCMGNLVA